MFERLLLIVLLAFGAASGAAAQDGEVARLQRRVAALEARREALLAATAERDSLALLAQDPRVVGKAPLFLRVPGWAADALELEVVRVVDAATARHGEAFQRAAPETLTVAYEPGRIRAGVRMIPVEELDTARSREEFLAARRFDIGRMASAKVDRLLGPTLLRWVGGRVDWREFEVGRRRAVILLASSPRGDGDRCLKGEVPACLEALEGDATSRTSELRASLFRFAMDRAGVEGWERLEAAAAVGGPVPEVIASVTGRPFPVLVAEWGAALRVGSTGDRTEVGRILLGLAWGLICVALFGWRLTWHRV